MLKEDTRLERQEFREGTLSTLEKISEIENNHKHQFHL
jgi:hypothetical protein